LNADPLFVSSTDLHLQTTSPAIGAGANLSAVFTTDADGNTRPSYGAWDIGAYQYFTPDVTAPSVPTALSAAAVSTSEIDLSWSASTDPAINGAATSGLAGYKVYRDGSQIGTTAGTTYEDTSLSSGTSYSYTVASYDNENNQSNQSASASATTSSPPVTSSHSSGGGGGGGGGGIIASTTSIAYLQNQIKILMAQLQALQAILASRNGGSGTFTTYNFTRDLSLNMAGDDVRALQQFLNTHGFIVANTGPGSPGNESTFFGAKTYQALVKFQASVNLPSSGFFGPMTRTYIKGM
jgi:hypothetical protein